MPQVSYELPVNAELQMVWDVLLNRIMRPDQFMSGVEDFRFLENEESHAIREVVTGGMALKERITIDEQLGQIRYELLDHPLFSGDVYNRLIPPAEDELYAKPMVSFVMNWQPLNEEARQVEEQFGQALEEGIRQAVLFVKQLAEEKNGNTPALNLPQEIVER